MALKVLLSIIRYNWDYNRHVASDINIKKNLPDKSFVQLERRRSAEMCYPVKVWKQHGRVFSKWPLVDTIALWARSCDAICAALCQLGGDITK